MIIITMIVQCAYHRMAFLFGFGSVAAKAGSVSDEPRRKLPNVWAADETGCVVSIQIQDIFQLKSRNYLNKMRKIVLIDWIYQWCYDENFSLYFIQVISRFQLKKLLNLNEN